MNALSFCFAFFFLIPCAICNSICKTNMTTSSAILYRFGQTIKLKIIHATQTGRRREREWAEIWCFSLPRQKFRKNYKNHQRFFVPFIIPIHDSNIVCNNKMELQFRSFVHHENKLYYLFDILLCSHEIVS